MWENNIVPLIEDFICSTSWGKSEAFKPAVDKKISKNVTAKKIKNLPKVFVLFFIFTPFSN
jgi:hypothetical protein